MRMRSPRILTFINDRRIDKQTQQSFPHLDDNAARSHRVIGQVVRPCSETVSSAAEERTTPIMCAPAKRANCAAHEPTNPPAPGISPILPAMDPATCTVR